MIRVETRGIKIERVLVVRLSAMGDVILTLPVVDALREKFPEARIDYLVKKEYAELVSAHPGINKVWTFERGAGFAGLREQVRDLKNERYDLLVDLHQNLRSHYLRWFGGAVMKRAYRKRVLERLLLKWFRINLLRAAPPVCDRYFTALEDFGIERDSHRPLLRLPASAREKAEATLSANGIGQTERFLALAPGASYPTKRWSPRRFAEAAAKLGPGQAVVILGASHDRAIAAEVSEELGRHRVRAVDLSGKLTISESAAIIGRASLLLTNDSGLMHVADAQDLPLVAVFGPTSRELGFYPQGKLARVVALEDLKCRPCSLHGDQVCSAGHHRCMEELPVEIVVAAARGVMGRNG